ncbi:hypothetical protein PRUPE_3G240500 [Prunus persica]|uniref:Uncharacterized protein n=1 Tax=Prunus persica TaxID=3760 RepID=A0A251Q4S7_PRUPE|nr:hypothetical protein PRUPE_3G240500 [Prunus persica]
MKCHHAETRQSIIILIQFYRAKQKNIRLLQQAFSKKKKERPGHVLSADEHNGTRQDMNNEDALRKER